MLIHVTQEDIDSGIPSRVACCPVALALNRALEKSFIVGGGYCYARVDKAPFYNLTKVVRQKIADFDHGKAISPFSFELDITEY